LPFASNRAGRWFSGAYINVALLALILLFGHKLLHIMNIPSSFRPVLGPVVVFSAFLAILSPWRVHGTPYVYNYTDGASVDGKVDAEGDTFSGTLTFDGDTFPISGIWDTTYPDIVSATSDVAPLPGGENPDVLLVSIVQSSSFYDHYTFLLPDSEIVLATGGWEGVPVPDVVSTFSIFILSLTGLGVAARRFKPVSS
jgi:hypothetical protein